MAKKLIGLDVNSTEVKIINPNGSVYNAQTPTNYIDGDGDLSVEALAEFVNGVKKDAKLVGSDCAVVLPENTTYYRTINCGVISDEQIKLNLPFEFKNYIGQEASAYNFDYIVDSVTNDENGKPKDLNLIAAAGRKATIDGFDAMLKKVGLKLKLALPKEICLINIMKASADANKEYCLIGVGYEYTNVYMFKGANLVATKAIDIGNREIDTVIAKELNIEGTEATLYRNTNKDNCLANEALKDVYDRIALEVMKTVNFYKYENNDSEVDTVYFFDMGCNNAQLNNTICKETTFKQGDINDLLPSSFKGKDDAARYLVSIGLVL